MDTEVKIRKKIAKDLKVYSAHFGVSHNSQEAETVMGKNAMLEILSSREWF